MVLRVRNSIKITPFGNANIYKLNIILVYFIVLKYTTILELGTKNTSEIKFSKN